MSDWTCYGNYNKNRQQCQECEHTEYCKEAKEAQPANTAYSDIAYCEDYASNDTPFTELVQKESNGDIDITDLSICVAALLELSNSRRQTYKVAMARIKYPLMSQRELARSLRIPLMSLNYHLKQIARLPMLSNLLPARNITLDQAARFFPYLKATTEAVDRLNDLKTQHPVTYKIVIDKMYHPEKSFSEIGEAVDCTKQNIQYHLRKSIQFYDALQDALLIDQRFNK